MDLQKLLKKTEQRSSKIKNTRTAPSVATDDRPYTNDIVFEKNTPSSSPQKSSKLKPKLSQSEAKVEPNLSQTRVNSASYHEPKLSQSEAKVEPPATKLSQCSITNKRKVEPQPEPHHEPKLSQSEAKVEPNDSFFSLVGLQRDAVRYIFDSCRFRGSKISGPIVICNLAIALRSTPAAVRKAIQRLEYKGCLQRKGFKDGRGGWTEYKLSDNTYNAMLLNESRAKVEPNLGQSRAKVEPQLEPQPEPRAPSSSSSYVLEELKTTTTGESDSVGFNAASLPSGWRDLDFSPLAEFGFTQSHLIQILKQGKLSETEVQDSVHFFAFDLNRNGKGSELNGSPLNFFMGILRKGTPYAPPANYENPADEARRKIREFKEKRQQERLAEEEKILNLEFNEWRRGLSQNEISKLVPEFARKPGPLHDSALKTHFENHVWPNLQKSPFEGEVPHENNNQPFNEPHSPVV